MSIKSKLNARLEAAEESTKKTGKSKILDVSNLRADGEGAIIMARPLTSGEKAKGKIKYIEGLDIASNNYGTYKVAAIALGRPDMAKEYARLYGTGEASPMERKSPKPGPAKTFQERLEDSVNTALAKNKLVDVSGLKQLKNGQWGGQRVVDKTNPKTGKEIYGDKYTGDKKMVDDYPIISNNYDHYEIAVNALDRNDLARDFAKFHGKNYDKRREPGAVSPAKKSPSNGAKGDKSAAEKLWAMYEKSHKENRELNVSKLTNEGVGSRAIERKGTRQINLVDAGKGAVTHVVSSTFEKFKLAMDLLDEYIISIGEEPSFYLEADLYYENHGAGPQPGLSPKERKGKSPKKTTRGRGAVIPRTGSPVRSEPIVRSRSPGKSFDSMMGRVDTRSASAERLRELRARSASAERLRELRNRSPVRKSSSSSSSSGSLSIPEGFDI